MEAVSCFDVDAYVANECDSASEGSLTESWCALNADTIATKGIVVFASLNEVLQQRSTVGTGADASGG